MYENFGAVVSGHSVDFKLFFPDTKKNPSQYVNGGLPRIKRMQVTGDFQSKINGKDWDFVNAPALTKTEYTEWYAVYVPHQTFTGRILSI